MNRSSAGAWIAIVAAGIITAGCAVGRSEVKLASPGAEPSQAAPATGKVVVLRTVKDERRFEEAPKDPSTPSLDGGASKASADEKARAIGRKRNSYGMAMGDVLLESGTSVEKAVRENLAAAFRDAGFQVRDSAVPGAMIVDARIRKFWSWMTPGVFAISIEATIETELSAQGASPVTVNAHATTSSMVGGDRLYIEVVDRALAQMRGEAASKVKAWR